MSVGRPASKILLSGRSVKRVIREVNAPSLRRFGATDRLSPKVRNDSLRRSPRFNRLSAMTAFVKGYQMPARYRTVRRVPRVGVSNSLPFFTTRIVGVLSPTNPFGIKAGGEGGCTPALAVVISAILDALAPLGVRDLAMPATPLKVWQAIRTAHPV